MDTVQVMMVLYVFILAIFVGFEIISKVPPTLHTPLMSGANAISGITILGATLIAGKYTDWSHWSGILGFFAVLFGALNVYGGYIVTDRMLAMFKTHKKKLEEKVQKVPNVNEDKTGTKK